jgi:hypothetical protein
MRGVTNPNPLAGFVASRRHSPNFAPNPNPAIRFVTFCMTAAARGVVRRSSVIARTDAGEARHVRG